MIGIIQVFTTTNSRKNANEIVKTLLAKRLASCVQIIGPINSTYWWKGRLEDAKEWLCLIKASAKDYRLIEANIKKVHPYDVPEILAVPVLEGNIDYLRWVRKETARGTKRKP